MRRKKIVSIAIIAFITFTIFYNSYFPDYMIVGEYRASIKDDFGTHGVKDGDKLILLEDGTFQSDCCGNGNYNVNGYKISFSFANEGFSTYFNRPLFFGDPRIIVFRDLNSEFIKK